MKRHALAAITIPVGLLVLLFLGASACWAKQAVVTLNNDQTLTGELVEENTQAITLRIAGILTPIARADVKDVRYVKELAEQYAEKRAALADDNIDGRYELAKWLFDNKALDLARKELVDLHNRKPDNYQINLLLKVVEERIKLLEQQNKPVETAAPGSGGPLPGAGKAEDGAGLPTKRLSDEQINLIKVYEIDLSITPPPHVIVPEKVIDDLLKQYASNSRVADIIKDRRNTDAFRAAEGYKQLQVLFDVQARPLYGKVIIRDDPPALKTFRTLIHQRYVLSYCGTNACHGGKNAGSLFLFRANANDENTVYTNFFILHRYANNSPAYMIDRDKPELSLLLQYGLPRANASFPHPDIADWRPGIVNDQDPKYTLIYNWIKNELNSNIKSRDNYHIDYQPPQPAPAAPTDKTPPAPPVKAP